jgi:hypothetical protein
LGLFFDYSKAFDSIEANVYLEKMKNYGTNDLSLSLLESYLRIRFQYVEIKYNTESENNLTAKSLCRVNELGVPQGSKTGPRIFNLYTNDMDHFVSEGKVVRFADDTTAIIIADTIDELQYKAQ